MWGRKGALALLACVGVVAVITGQAAAAPVFYTKVVVGGIAPAVKFTGSLGAAVMEGSVSKSKLECSAASTAGEASGATTVNGMVIDFTGCKTGGFTCKSGGQPEGEIVTNVLAGELGDVVSGTPGLRLFEESGGRGGELAGFSCAGGAIGVKEKGSLTGALSIASGKTVLEAKFQTSLKVTYVQSGGIQKYSKFVGESGSEQVEAKFGEGAYEDLGFSVNATLTANGVSNLGVTK
jgi:hypothetical protein